MKTLAIALATAVLAAASFASSAAESVPSVRFDCNDQVRPSMELMRTGFGIANFDQAYDARSSLHRTVQRACARGSSYVEIVFENRSAETPFRAIAAR